MSVAVVQEPFGGELSRGVLASVLSRLQQDGMTGILAIQSEQNIIAVSVEAGLIVGADALNEPLEEGLGRVLIEDGLLTKKQFMAVVERIPSERGRLDEILLADTGLSRLDYLAALRRYTSLLVVRGCSWGSGEYKFFAGDEVSREEDFDPIEFDEIALDEVSIEEENDTESATDPLIATDPLGAESISEGPPAVAYGAETNAPALSEVETAAAAMSLDTSPEEVAELESLRARLLRYLDEAPQWLSWALPFVAGVVLVAVVTWGPSLLMYPVFWLEPERLAFDQQRRTSVYLKIDRAARTFFLLEGRFPDDLHTLVARDLLSARDIVGSRGRLLTYVPHDRGYVISPATRDGTEAGSDQSEAIAGDFFLDPEYVVRTPNSDAAPLILLD